MLLILRSDISQNIYFNIKVPPPVCPLLQQLKIMLRLRTLFLCPSNTRSKNQQWRKKRRIFKRNSQVVFPSPFPFPEFSDRVLSRDSRRWRSSNKSADVHLTVNADAVRLVTSVQCPGHSHCCQGLSVSVSGLRSVCTSSHFVRGAPC